MRHHLVAAFPVSDTSPMASERPTVISSQTPIMLACFETGHGNADFHAAINLQSQTLPPAGGAAPGSHIDPARKHRLLNRLDDISLTLHRADRIRASAHPRIHASESQRRTTEPWLFT